MVKIKQKTRECLLNKIESFYNNYKDLFYSIAYNYTNSLEQAQDIVHTIISKIIGMIEENRIIDFNKSYVVLAIRRLGIDYYRRSIVGKEKHETFTLSDVIWKENEDLHNREKDDVIEYISQLLEDFAHKDKELLVMRFYGGLKFKELAKHYDEKLTKITARFYDCLKYLRLKMKKEMNNRA